MFINIFKKILIVLGGLLFAYAETKFVVFIKNKYGDYAGYISLIICLFTVNLLAALLVIKLWFEFV